ncbi:MAG: HNH endonuclease, partial [Myxococcales bacterium]
STETRTAPSTLGAHSPDDLEPRHLFIEAARRLPAFVSWPGATMRTGDLSFTRPSARPPGAVRRAMTEKERVRERFRAAVFRRAGHRCQGPGCSFRSREATSGHDLDAHHITDRREMPHGGYVADNGIALCPTCHERAEVFHSTGTAVEGWHPDDLYRVIGSSREQAETASAKLR